MLQNAQVSSRALLVCEFRVHVVLLHRLAGLHVHVLQIELVARLFS